MKALICLFAGHRPERWWTTFDNAGREHALSSCSRCYVVFGE